MLYSIQFDIQLADRHTTGTAQQRSLKMNEKINKIEALKKEKNAVIMAHYYVADEMQQLADVCRRFLLSQ